MHFEFATASRIVFGEGEARQLDALAAQWGRTLVVTGSQPDRVRRLAANLSHSLFPVAGEPTIDLVCAGLEQARREDCRGVISIERRQRHRCGKGDCGAAHQSGRAAQITWKWWDAWDSR